MGHNSKKWLIACVALIIAFVTTLSVTVYIIDPFFQFRAKDNAYLLNPIFVSTGLIKNYDYDTLIIGSSMTQNFDMQMFRDELGLKPLHIGIGGIRATEEKELLELAYETGKAKKYYICAETSLFTADSKQSRIPYYLIEEDFLSRCRYFFNYEAWFRFMPIDVGFMILDKTGVEESKKVFYSRSIDRLGDWSLDYKFGRDIVLNNYKTGAYGVSKVETEDLYNKMRTRIDQYFDCLQLDEGKHVFFFAPYSMLYWASQSDELVDVLLCAKKYFAEKALEKGLTVYDFQSIDFTDDLDNYRDTTHYKHEINDYMVRCFVTGEHSVTMKNYDEYENKLINMRNDFKTRNIELFE